MTLRTKSIYEASEESDGLRLLVTRYYPRGVKKDRFDRWLRELSPSRALLRAYRQGEKSWDVFRSEFVAEMKANPSSVEAIGMLRGESSKGPVTILCYERSGSPCHRLIVADLVGDPEFLVAPAPPDAVANRDSERPRRHGSSRRNGPRAKTKVN